MQKFGPKPQYLSEISGFQNFVKLRFRIALTGEKWFLISKKINIYMRFKAIANNAKGGL